MDLVVFTLREWDETKRPIFDEFLSHVPYHYQRMVQELITRPYGREMPSVSKFMLKLNAIKSASQPEDKHYIERNLNLFLSLFVEKEIYSLRPEAIRIPQFNLLHYGNICHLNVCLNILSSLFELVFAMNLIKHPSPPFKILRQYITNGLSPVDLHPNLIFDVMSICKINPVRLEESEETFKKLMHVLYTGLNRKLIFFWDSSDTFVDAEDKSLSMRDVVGKYQPKYLIVNAQDFNIVNEIDSTTTVPLTFATHGMAYNLSSIVISLPSHFISAFKQDDSSLFVVRNDLNHRFHDETIDVSEIKHTITLACYVREE